MSKLNELNQAAREIFAHALAAVHARAAVRDAMRLEGTQLTVRQSTFDLTARNIYVLAIGKAAPAMAAGLLETGIKISGGVISGLQSSSLQSLDTNKWRLFEGGHPLPNEQSLDAAQAAFRLLDRANEENGLVVFLISGGGSAMLEWPRSEDVSLADLQEANRQLISCGARIDEINAVRRTFSAVKGGDLAKRATRAAIVTLIIWDTNPNDEANVASGPTITPQTAGVSVPQIVRRYGLDSTLPKTILRSIETFTASKAPAVNQANPPHYVLLDNETALRAAARRASELGFTVEVATDIREQPIIEGCQLMLDRLNAASANARPGQTVCVVSGGEFSCPVRGEGVGGRNLETVLRCAMKPGDNESQTRVFLSAGTDGIDGNSPAAGAVADNTTLSRASELGMDANSYLEKSDAFNFFDRLGDAIVTGPTGTNVRDVQVLLAWC